MGCGSSSLSLKASARRKSVASLALKHGVSVEVAADFALAFDETALVFEPNGKRKLWSRTCVELLAKGTFRWFHEIPLTNVAILSKTLLVAPSRSLTPGKGICCDTFVDHVLGWNSLSFADKAEQTISCYGFDAQALVTEDDLEYLLETLIPKNVLCESRTKAEIVHSIVLECKVHDLLTLGKHRDPLGQNPTMRASEIIRWFVWSAEIERFHVTHTLFDIAVSRPIDTCLVGSDMISEERTQSSKLRSKLSTIDPDDLERTNNQQHSTADADTVDGGGGGGNDDDAYSEDQPRIGDLQTRESIRRTDTHETDATRTTSVIKIDSQHGSSFRSGNSRSRRGSTSTVPTRESERGYLRLTRQRRRKSDSMVPSESPPESSTSRVFGSSLRSSTSNRSKLSEVSRVSSRARHDRKVRPRQSPLRNSTMAIDRPIAD
eukprot:m.232988 g.232988  ORF g.232988 m.232988 type:complete len:434 (-) comp26077_c0_seq5:2245-3546(-)